ncbi:uncharacterized protein LOC128559210 [Mercenaria mercenaria]|uniref:uncharacterized protein LOC128559210 n=1 Tax=Mercenaria mercenaria TaxID=6596 RepID=UPI00234E7B16|nr:uncharacterized protein LOC128559210 [Mercenaria mercenaria]
MARWLEVLSQYNFKIEHRSGKKHINADSLSRIPCEPEECQCYDGNTILKVYHLNYGDNNEEGLNKDVNAILDEHVALSEDAAQTSNLGCLKQFNTVNCSPVKMAKLQRADPDLGIVIQWLEENRRPLRDKVAGNSPSVRNYG